MGQLPFSTSEDQLRQLFTDNEIGGPLSSCIYFLEVRQIRMMREKETNKFRGMIHVIGFR